MRNKGTRESLSDFRAGAEARRQGSVESKKIKIKGRKGGDEGG